MKTPNHLKLLIPFLALGGVLQAQVIIPPPACPTANPVTVTSATFGTSNRSLSWAINCINNVPALNQITFNIPAAQGTIINLGTNNLPAIKKNGAIIQGGNYIIDGTSNTAGMAIDADRVTINALKFRDFNANNFVSALYVFGDQATVTNSTFYSNTKGVFIGAFIRNASIRNNVFGLDGTTIRGNTTAIELGEDFIIGVKEENLEKSRLISFGGSITNNVIAYNTTGILIDDTRTAFISRNSMYCNRSAAINHIANIPLATITSATPLLVTGRGSAGDTVEVFRSDNSTCTGVPCNQGKTFLASVVVPASGTWSVAIPVTPSSALLTTTITRNNNTSEFSPCFPVQNVCGNFNATATATNVDCAGNTNGRATVNTTGGINVNLSYLWSTKGTTQTISNLAPGRYTVTVTDGAGCRDTTSTLVGVSSNMQISGQIVNASCPGTARNGSIALSVTNGVSPYTYRWNTGATTANLTNIPAGSYTVTVSDRFCTQSRSFVVNGPAPVLVSVNQKDATCSYDKNGSVVLTPTSGVAPYTYSWNNGALGNALENLAPSTYVVTVSDSRGCFTPVTVNIGAPPPLQASLTSTNPSCKGENTGTATVTPIGGSGPYSYFWSNGATTSSINNLGPGAYEVLVVDTSMCQVNNKISINPGDSLRIFSSITPPTCGNPDGRISVDPSGGSSAYSYFWDNGASTNSIDKLVAGNYSLTVTDQKGCKSTEQYNLLPSSAMDLRLSANSINCFGEKTGDIKSTVIGGAEPYTYLWNTSATSSFLSGVGTGTYILSVTDAQGCIDTAQLTLTSPNALSALLESKNPLCYNQNTGQINTIVQGGIAPYTYQWNTGATSAELNNLAKGQYQLVVSDFNGCRDTLQTSITPPDSLSVLLKSQDPTCFNQLDGFITSNVSGGTGPYTYLWNNNAISSDLNNLGKGTYTLQVSDFNGCKDTSAIQLNSPPELVTRVVITNPVCSGQNTGQIISQTSGGTAPYLFQWSNNTSENTINNLGIGTYFLTVTDAKGCLDTIQATLVAPSSVMVTLQSINPLCSNLKTGQVTATIQGGASPYLYKWSNNATSNSLQNLSTGTYVLTVTDNNGCTDTASAVLQAPNALSVALSTLNPLCNGKSTGQITSKVTGGATPYIYLWSNGASSTAIANLAAGNYWLQISDRNGCKDTIETTLNAPNPIVIQLAPKSLDCFGQQNGQIQSSVTGGTAPYDYRWNNNSTDTSIENLGAGTYTLMVSDSNGCVDSARVDLAQPDQLKLSLSPLNPKCANENTGQITGLSTGGTAPYFYRWNTRDTLNTINNLGAGTYSLIVQDSKACVDSAQATLDFPAPILISLNPVNPLCNGDNSGQVISSISNGVAPFTYLWSNQDTSSSLLKVAAGNYTLTVTDVNGCMDSAQTFITAPDALGIVLKSINPLCNGQNSGELSSTVSGGTKPYAYRWNTQDSTSTLKNIGVGSYALTVSDENGCKDTARIDLSAPSALMTSLNVQPVLCNGQNTGQIVSVISGGQTPYTYQWSNNATTSNLNNLSAGTYLLTVTDANNCTDTARASITSLNPIVTRLSAQNPLCNGQNTGQITSTVSGGTAPYTYRWNTNATTNTLNNLGVGNYVLTLTDANQCMDTAQVNLVAPTALLASLNPQHLLCKGQNTGQITSMVSGGTAPYAYRWTNNATTSTLNNLGEGTYSLTVTDANNCTNTAQTSLNAPPPLQLTHTQTNESRNNGRDGTISVTAEGGVKPYRYSWSNGATTSNINNLAAGIYILEVSDANNCKASLSVTIQSPACTSLNITAETTNVSCPGQSNGKIQVKVSGGQAPYNYTWSSGESGASLSGLDEGIYQVTVTDALGCFNTLINTLTASGKAPKTLYGLAGPDTVCGNTPFTLRADDLFPGANVKYVWQFPNGEEKTTTERSIRITPTSTEYSGEYSVRRDSSGCQSAVFGPVFVDIVALSPNSFSAGRDTVICKGNAFQLNGKTDRGVPTWSALTGQMKIANPNSLQTNVENLQIGENKLVLKVQLARCVLAGVDTLVIFVESRPHLKDDHFTIEYAQDAALMNVLLNDDLKGVRSVNLMALNAPQNGQFEFLSENQSFRFIADIYFRGKIDYQYIVCDDLARCTTPCDTAAVSIDVLNYPKPTEGLVLKDPGKNGTLLIKGLEAFGRVEISITNRWGDIVYNNNNYSNDSPWKGQTNNGGAFLPPGAYYYVLRAYDNNVLVGKPQTGAIYLFLAEE